MAKLQSGQKKLIIYGSAALVCGIIAAVVAAVPFRTGAAYAIFYGGFGAAVGGVLARTAYHIILKDYAPEMWQISIYLLVASAGWLGAVLALSWGWVSLWLSVMCIGILMAVGTRFCKSVAKTRVSASLETTLRYRLSGDKLDGKALVDSPLTVVKDNVALTVAEAENQGFKDAAKKGRDYIKSLLEEGE